MRPPSADERRTEPAFPRIEGFPDELAIWIDDDAGLRVALRLAVDRDRLRVDFADPDLPDDRRWWEDWDEAVAAGVAGIIPAGSINGPIETLYVTGLGDDDPTALFRSLVAEGRVGLLQPGLPTNSVDGAPAAPLADDPAIWWDILNSPIGGGDLDVSQALTGDPDSLGNMPGGDRSHRAPASALVTALWPALWGFAASQVFDIARGPEPARWASGALFPEGAYPTVRIGPQPYGLLPTTAWSRWRPDDDAPPFEAPLTAALIVLRSQLAEAARARQAESVDDTQGLLDRLSDTPTSETFRFRQAWPLELWWLAAVSSGLSPNWRRFAASWRNKHRLAEELKLNPLRRYGTRGQSRLIELPLVVPAGASAGSIPTVLRRLAAAALANPRSFANTVDLEKRVLGHRGDSLLVRLVIRSLQLLIADSRRERSGALSFDPEPFSRNRRELSRLQELILSADPPDFNEPTPVGQQLQAVADSLHLLGTLPVEDLERRLRATIDASSHRVDPWLVAIPQRRLDTLQERNTLKHRLGAYGWVDRPEPGRPGPTEAGLIHTPSATAALAAAVLRDRAVSDPSQRWDLDITSRTARAARRLAEQVKVGGHIQEVLGREVERIVGRGADIETLHQAFPVRTEHAGRRVCDGLQVLAQDDLPVTLATEEVGELADLEAAFDTYGDLLVSDAVHQLVEGRADIAGETMDAAAGLSHPPELSLLRTMREGRGISSSAVLVLPQVPGSALPRVEHELALVSPSATLDPSVAKAVATRVGDAAQWDFEISVVHHDEPSSDQRVTVTLADLALTPADALSLTQSVLQRLAIEQATAGESGSFSADVIGGLGEIRYEQAASLVALVGRRPATRRSVAESRTTDPAGEPVDSELVSRYLRARKICVALASRLRAQVVRLGDDGGLGTANESELRSLLAACTGWGIAPDPPTDEVAGAPMRRLAERTKLALPQLDARLAAAPESGATANLGRDEFLEAAAALVSPTGQLGLTVPLAARDLPASQPDDGDRFDATWLTTVAAVRPTLARLEVYQLSVDSPFVPWVNRGGDPWQTDLDDPRSLVVAYADASIDIAGLGPGEFVATATLDQFEEVIPNADQVTGAAFGFDAPGARAQQAILLAVPPDTNTPLDEQMLAQILIETRELAHARMARPVDLGEQLRGLVPTGLLPASGPIATSLEALS